MTDTRFLKIVSKTLEHEGGYVNDPADPGGETQWGISKRAYFHMDIKNLTREGAIEIYERDYWKKPGWDRLKNDELSGKLFDLGVNMGPGKAARILQSSLNLLGFKTPVDGDVGIETVAYANACKYPGALLMAVRYYATQHYISLNKPRFLAGWLARLAA